MNNSLKSLPLPSWRKIVLFVCYMCVHIIPTPSPLTRSRTRPIQSVTLPSRTFVPRSVVTSHPAAKSTSRWRCCRPSSPAAAPPCPPSAGKTPAPSGCSRTSSSPPGRSGTQVAFEISKVCNRVFTMGQGAGLRVATRRFQAMGQTELSTCTAAPPGSWRSRPPPSSPPGPRTRSRRSGTSLRI
jgi:hypothetical protein